MTKNRGDFGGRTFIADLKLTSGKLVFAVLRLPRHDAATHSAMEMFPALPGVATGLGMTTGAHHRYSDRGERIAKRRALACAEHDPNLRKCDAQRAHHLHKPLVAHRE